VIKFLEQFLPENVQFDSEVLRAKNSKDGTIDIGLGSVVDNSEFLDALFSASPVLAEKSESAPIRSQLSLRISTHLSIPCPVALAGRSQHQLSRGRNCKP
jgi:hypothetical protein